MAAIVMTVEFGSMHHYSSLEGTSEACLCRSLDKYKQKLNGMLQIETCLECLE